MSRRIPILLYHRVGPRDGSFMDEYTVSPQAFADQMDWIARHKWRPTSLDRAVSGEGTGDATRLLVITFDDGFASNRTHAWPVLTKHGFPAATFIVTERMGGLNTWDGPSRARYSLLSAEDLAEADPRFMTFHSHSATHADLTSLTEPTSLRRELEEPRRRLAGLRTAGHLFAYPWGSWNWAVMEQVRDCGYVGACTTLEGLNSARTNPFLLRRIEIGEHDVGWRLWLKLRSGRDLLRWPPSRPPECSVFLAWLRRRRRPGAPNRPTAPLARRHRQESSSVRSPRGRG